MFPYKDASLPIPERVKDLVGRMTLEEKVLQTDQYGLFDYAVMDGDFNIVDLDEEAMDRDFKGKSLGVVFAMGGPAICNKMQHYAVERTRLGIPYMFSTEALHGIMRPQSTSFPQQIGLAATFDPDLGYRMGRAIATEGRAHGIHETFSPVMDLMRDPRFGRTEEGYGEDIFLSSEFARATVRGIQGDDFTASDTMISEPKHYTGYGNPVGGLNCAPSTMGRHDVFSDCQPVFEAAVKEAGAVNIMCSYASIDAMPVSADHEILTDVLRGEWGMRGFVRTDMTAVSRLYDWHYTRPTPEEAIKTGLEAGCDLQLFDFTHEVWQNGIMDLVRSGRMEEAVLDQAVSRVLTVKFMLGLFEDPYTDVELEKAVMNCQAHQDLAQEIAEKGIILLKNDPVDGKGGKGPKLLPIDLTKVKKIALLGPSAAVAQRGDYAGPCDHAISPLEGIRQVFPEDVEVLYEKGCNILGDEIHPFEPEWLTNEEGGKGLTLRFYNGRSIDTEPVAVQNAPTINNNWIILNPDPKVNQNCFSAVWTGKLCVPEGFTGCIGMNSHDSMKLFLDGELLIDGWGEEKESSQMLEFTFESGRVYDLRVEFTNDCRGARIIAGYNRGREDYSAAIAAAKEADLAVLCMGDDESTSGENFDRMNLDLPGNQPEFVKAIYATGTPVVLVMISGRPVSCTWEDAHIPAILEAFYPGEKGGIAIARTLLGLNNPSGHLPITFPRHVGQIPCHHSRRPGGGRRYVEMDWRPLYGFGYGLSYTSFRFSDLTLEKTVIRPGETLKCTVTVENTGDRPGTAVPQLYIRDMISSMVKPMLEHAAFTRVELMPGEKRVVEMEVTPRVMRTLGPDYVWRVEPGDFTLMLGENAEKLLEYKSFIVEE